jgi:hypothetical protein
MALPSPHSSARPRPSRPLPRALGFAICLLFACSAERAHSVERSTAAASGNACRGHVAASLPLPGVKPEETTLPYWLARYSATELDRPLLSEPEIAAYNARIGRRQGESDYSQRDLRVPMSQLELRAMVSERLSHQLAELNKAELVQLDGRPVTAERLSAFSGAVSFEAPSQRVVLEKQLLRCGPLAEGLYHPDKPSPQPAYDHNACGPLAAQEPVELLGRASNGMQLVRSRYSLGFLPTDAALSAPVPAAWSDAFLGSERLVAAPGASLSAAQSGKTFELKERTALAVAHDGSPVLATAEGFVRLQKSPKLTAQTQPLTRRALLTAALSRLGEPYGLGGTQGGVDCSGLLVDMFEGFDIALPRFSGWQAQSGSFSVDVSQLSPDEKLRRLDLAAKDGVVLLHFPGHIMLYLGRAEDGQPRVLHSLGDYLVPCAGGEDTVDVQRVVVSGLGLGQHTSRTSLLERLTRLVVFGPPPTAALQTEADLGPAAPPRAPTTKATCRDSEQHTLFVSPLNPQPGEPMRAISTSQSDPGGASLRIFDDKGNAVPIAELTLGGPPFGHVARAQLPAGNYAIVLGQADEPPLACRRLKVRKLPKPKSSSQEGDPYWEPRTNWSRATEGLYALFVEQLFAGPPDDEQTWTNLHSLLRDPDRNLLLDHLQLGEDKQLKIEPDCADLPYSLRAYFAWKLRLPYGYRACNRGGRERPPTCGEVHTPLEPRKAAEEVAAFSEFVNRGVRWSVHSATGRTAPDDSESDLYPVALERQALTPGTVYADPYGHVMLISKWFGQGSIHDSPIGVMIAAEAQPDGTIGRRRFWQGSFLFDPNTKAYGAGFKRFRPFDFDRKLKTLTPLDNAALGKQRELPRFSRAQYEITREDFYEQMDTLINPQPLAPSEHLQNLVAALDEAARRRVLSVNNGEDYKKSHPGQVIAMPRGYEVFETQGAWEDFATPSRDMRMLIAIDTVSELPGRVEKHPERFALPKGTSPSQAAKSLRAALDRELQGRSFQYTRSDGSAQTLTLADVVARAAALEVAYNPNDCVEARWGAPAGSDEIKTCKQRAPDDQRQLLETYRSWFHARTRPPRGK